MFLKFSVEPGQVNRSSTPHTQRCPIHPLRPRRRTLRKQPARGVKRPLPRGARCQAVNLPLIPVRRRRQHQLHRDGSPLHPFPERKKQPLLERALCQHRRQPKLPSRRQHHLPIPCPWQNLLLHQRVISQIGQHRQIDPALKEDLPAARSQYRSNLPPQQRMPPSHQLGRHRLDSRFGSRFDSRMAGVVQPVPLTLERIARQGDRDTPPRTVEAVPVHRSATPMQQRQTLQHLLPFFLFGLNAAQPQTTRIRRQTLLAKPQQRCLGATFHQHVDPQPSQRLHPPRKLHRLAQMLTPIRRRRQPLLSQMTGDIRNHRQLRTPIPHRFGHSHQFIQNRLHQRRMRSHINFQRPRGNAGLLQRTDRILNRRNIPRYHQILRRVDRRQSNRPRIRSQDTPDVGFPPQHSHHLPLRSHLLHQPPAGRHQFQAIFQREDPRHTRSSVLAQAMPQHRRRLDPPGTPERSQRIFHRKQRRLGIGRCIQQRVGHCRVKPIQDLQQRPLQPPPQKSVTLLQDLPKQRLCGVQLMPHTGILRALPGKQKRHTRGRLSPPAADNTRYLAPIARLAQPGTHAVQVGRNNPQPVIPVGPTGGCGVTQIRQPALARLVGRRQFQNLLHPLDLSGQRLLAARRQCQQLTGTWLVPHRQFKDRRRFHNQMHIGASQPKTADPCQTPLCWRPLHRNDRHSQQRTLPGNVRVRSVKVKIGRNLARLQRKHHLDQRSNPRSRRQVANVAFDRPQPERLGPPCTQHLEKRLHLDRIPQHGARAMRFNILDLRRLQMGVLQRLAQHRLLSTPVRCRQPVAGPVMIDRRTTNHRQHPVSVALCIRQTLQNHHASPFADSKSIGPCRKGLASPIRRNSPHLTKPNQLFRPQQQADPASQRQITLPDTQRLASQMHRQQRRRAGRVHLHGRPLQPQHIGQPPRCHPTQMAQQTVAVNLVGGRVVQVFG